ncbi:putative vacuolar protein sorting-associated protein [Trypanosoma rangeli]|uniref:Putative vacuolar protein sorting-associated protein n=1 Tax=Trypanosoma rangeli TaxID=5698 RepID=A0A422P2E3_TRYRA|nr:putative vacuolar protein sorting-associated protein [Trypanosoma rangeli]RNF11844.1 putative vacuolar protein sorting-associated protein [Trypanosoma rangeli]|eukprot:RNF11844.1 putative vacuolar protein sorting-associated protein [Trypanosoma rangeli]
MTLAPRARLNCIEQAWAYIDRILDGPDGLKVLLCDDATRNIISVVYSQHQLLQHNVVLVDMLSNREHYPMKHLHCIIFCRPLPSSLACVYQELAEGNFASFSLYFSHLLESNIVQSLANADLLNLTRALNEVYLDSVPLTEYVAIAQLKPTALHSMAGPIVNPITYSQWDSASLDRMTEAIVSLMLMTNRRPAIRYRGGNKVSEKLAKLVAGKLKTVHQSFPDLKAKESVLVILDRMDDPVTALVMPWTYEAMIHEIIGFQYGNEVTIDDPDAKPEERVHVLTAHTDPFFAQHRYDDYGQVCIAVSELVKAYKALNNFDRNNVSLDEIKSFMSRFPEARKQSVQVTRHCGLASQLVTEVNGRNLTHLSVLEQEMLTSSNVAEHSRQMMDIVQDPKTDIDDALRMVMLYALRYEKVNGNNIAQLKEMLEKRNCPVGRISLIDRVLEYGGADKRLHQLFRVSTGHMLKIAAKAVGHFGKDIQNILTQYVPLMKKLINRVYNGTLSEEKYPVQEVEGAPIAASAVPTIRAKDIIIVMVGGVTYSEAMLLHQINQGQVPNNVESLMNLGKNVTRFVSGDPSANAASSEPYSENIEARVTLLSTSMIDSKDFIHSLPS